MEIAIRGFQKVEIVNLRYSVLGNHRFAGSRHLIVRLSGTELMNILKISVLRREIIHVPKRKQVDLDDSTCLDIIF